MADDILRAALVNLHQEDRFGSCWECLQAEWIVSLQDLQLAAANDTCWSSLALPIRLKVEILGLLANANLAAQSVAVQQEVVVEEAREPAAVAATDWQLFYDDGQQAYYYYNAITGESQWAENVQDQLEAVRSSSPSPLPARRPGTNANPELSQETDDSVEEKDAGSDSDSTSSEGSKHYIITERPGRGRGATGVRTRVEVEEYTIRPRSPLPPPPPLELMASAPPADMDADLLLALALGSPMPPPPPPPPYSPDVCTPPTPIPASQLTHFPGDGGSDRYPVHFKPTSPEVHGLQAEARRMLKSVFGHRAHPAPIAPAPPSEPSKITRLTEMGFSPAAATYALQLAGGDLDEATAMLLESTRRDDDEQTGELIGEAVAMPMSPSPKRVGMFRLF